ncbi:MAG: exodeoxyribonuclease III [Acidimicrobiales bacterium]
MNYLREQSKVRIASWNINSIRTRHDRVLAWIERHQPDVVALQETKCTDDVFEALAGDYLEQGYEWAHWGHDHWNGVAILSRVGLEDEQRGFRGHNRSPYDQARLLTATCGTGERQVRISSLYVPNGRELDDPHYLYKLVWLERLRSELGQRGDTLLLGDFNVAPADIDIYDPSRWRRKTHASPPERAAIEALLDADLVDVTRQHLPGPGVYTWWSYRPGQFEANRGLRIDLALASPRVAHRVHSVWIDAEERGGERPSDHAPLVLDLTN